MTQIAEIVHFGWPRSAPIDKTKSKFLNKLYWKFLEIYTISSIWISMNYIRVYHIQSLFETTHPQLPSGSKMTRCEISTGLSTKPLPMPCGRVTWLGNAVVMRFLASKWEKTALPSIFSSWKKLRLSISEPVSESVSLYSMNIEYENPVGCRASLLLKSCSLCQPPLSSTGRSEESKSGTFKGIVDRC